MWPFCRRVFIQPVGWVVMEAFRGYCGRLWSWFFSPINTDGFDFVPTEPFGRFIGEGARYEVSNPVDVLLQQRGLLSDLLLVEISTAGYTYPMCFRYSIEDLSRRGSAACTLYHAQLRIEGLQDGVCGHLRDRKRV